MSWVLRRRERDAQGHVLYVMPAGSERSYGRSSARARTFDTREEAQSEACGNEDPIPTPQR